MPRKRGRHRRRIAFCQRSSLLPSQTRGLQPRVACNGETTSKAPLPGLLLVIVSDCESSIPLAAAIESSSLWPNVPRQLRRLTTPLCLPAPSPRAPIIHTPPQPPLQLRLAAAQRAGPALRAAAAPATEARQARLPARLLAVELLPRSMAQALPLPSLRLVWPLRLLSISEGEPRSARYRMDLNCFLSAFLAATPRCCLHASCAPVHIHKCRSRF